MQQNCNGEIDIEIDIDKDIDREGVLKHTRRARAHEHTHAHDISYIEKIFKENNFTADPKNFHSYYELRDWKISNGQYITEDKLLALATRWNATESNFNRKNNSNSYGNRVVKEVPEWLAEYEQKIADMEPE